MDRWRAARLAERLMREHGLTTWRFAFNRRKRAMGVCRYEQQRVELSIHFVLRNEESAVRDTVLHEIAHALAGRDAGHGQKWKRICRRIGATPRSCGEAAMPRGRWRGRCPGCGFEYARHRRPDRGRTYHCRRCGPEAGSIKFVMGEV